jgi:hypothetical protein
MYYSSNVVFEFIALAVHTFSKQGNMKNKITYTIPGYDFCMANNRPV